jgi:uncharacterized iron-regulated protein
MRRPLRTTFAALHASGTIALALVAPGMAGDAIGAADGTPCVQPAAWTRLDDGPPRIVAAADVLPAMARRDVVLLGEQHDERDDHRWQLQVLAALHAQRPDMVIGFEMFPRRAQPALDEWVAGKLTVAEFLARVEWEKVWQLPAELYLPLFQFARINRVPMVALNVDQALVHAISEKGWAAVPDAQREGVGKPAPASRAYREFLAEAYDAHAAANGKPEPRAPGPDRAFDRFVESQTTWDRAMAEALAGRVKSRPGAARPLAVGIMGSGHVRFGYGVPHQLRDLGVTNIGTLLPVAADVECKALKPGLANAVFALPEQVAPKPQPPRLGVQLEHSDGAVRIVSVTAGSLAERTGLKAGDRVVEVAGAPVTSMQQLIAAVRLQPPGTWLPMRLKRGDDAIEVVVRFPPAQ